MRGGGREGRRGKTSTIYFLYLFLFHNSKNICLTFTRADTTVTIAAPILNQLDVISFMKRGGRGGGGKEEGKRGDKHFVI